MFYNGKFKTYSNVENSIMKQHVPITSFKYYQFMANICLSICPTHFIPISTR